LGIVSGFPYGPFFYGDAFGAKLFGIVPWVVFFAWPPLVLGAWSFFRERFGERALWLAPLALVLVDVVLDPVNAALGFWVWPSGGFFYGVPLSNFAGWLFSGCVGVALMRFLFPRGLPLFARWSLVLVLLFATTASLWLALWLPFVLGVALSYLAYRFVLVSTEKLLE
jgi:putative membrane protein